MLHNFFKQSIKKYIQVIAQNLLLKYILSSNIFIEKYTTVQLL